jgi:hypothetical protein
MTKKRILGCLRVSPVEYHWSRPHKCLQILHHQMLLLQTSQLTVFSIEILVILFVFMNEKPVFICIK